jgi:hypothetical protein
VRKFLLWNFLPAVQCIKNLQGAYFTFRVEAFTKPFPEAFGFFGKAKPHEGTQAKGGVAQPRIAIIPIALASYPFR